MGVLLLLLATFSTFAGLWLLAKILFGSPFDLDNAIKELEALDLEERVVRKKKKKKKIRKPKTKAQVKQDLTARYKSRKIQREVLEELINTNPELIEEMIDDQVFKDWVKNLKRRGISERTVKKIQEALNNKEALPEELMQYIKVR